MQVELEIVVPALELDGAFSCTAAPVQAEGTLCGYPFYFRSRHDEWTFAVAPKEDGDAVEIKSTEQGFFRKETYGTKLFEASYMPLEEARRIIKNCAGEFRRSNGYTSAPAD